MIRKFEQEAIVNQIMEGISEKADKQIEKAKKSADYRAIVKMTEKLQKLREQRDALSRTLNKEEQAVNQANLRICFLPSVKDTVISRQRESE